MIKIQRGVLLSKYTTFRIGGPAKFFTEVVNIEELKEALDYAQKNNLEFFVLGGGSNLLVSDKGYNGIVIQCKLTTYNLQPTINTIEVGAGIPLAKVVRESAEHNLAGLEWATGIPGTVGGAVRGDAGAYGGDAGSVIDSVRVLEVSNDEKEVRPLSVVSVARGRTSLDFQLKIYHEPDCKFGYRESIFKQNKNLIILSAVF